MKKGFPARVLHYELIAQGWERRPGTFQTVTHASMPVLPGLPSEGRQAGDKWGATPLVFIIQGWDFDNIWYIAEGQDYPKLRNAGLGGGMTGSTTNIPGTTPGGDTGTGTTPGGTDTGTGTAGGGGNAGGGTTNPDTTPGGNTGGGTTPGGGGGNTGGGGNAGGGGTGGGGGAIPDTGGGTGNNGGKSNTGNVTGSGVTTLDKTQSVTPPPKVEDTSKKSTNNNGQDESITFQLNPLIPDFGFFYQGEIDISNITNDQINNIIKDNMKNISGLTLLDILNKVLTPDMFEESVMETLWDTDAYLKKVGKLQSTLSGLWQNLFGKDNTDTLPPELTKIIKKNVTSDGSYKVNALNNNGKKSSINKNATYTTYYDDGKPKSVYYIDIYELPNFGPPPSYNYGIIETDYSSDGLPTTMKISTGFAVTIKNGL